MSWWHTGSGVFIRQAWEPQNHRITVSPWPPALSGIVFGQTLLVARTSEKDAREEAQDQGLATEEPLVELLRGRLEELGSSSLRKLHPEMLGHSPDSNS